MKNFLSSSISPCVQWLKSTGCVTRDKNKEEQYIPSMLWWIIESLYSYPYWIVWIYTSVWTAFDFFLRPPQNDLPCQRHTYTYTAVARHSHRARANYSLIKYMSLNGAALVGVYTGVVGAGIWRCTAKSAPPAFCRLSRALGCSTIVQNRLMQRHLIIHFPTSLWMSEWASKLMNERSVAHE